MANVGRDVFCQLAVSLDGFRRALALCVLPKPLLHERRKEGRVWLHQFASVLLIQSNTERVLGLLFLCETAFE